MGIQLKQSLSLLSAMALAATAPFGPGIAAAAPHTAKDREPGIVGTWRLVRYEDTAKDGSVSRPYGERPTGYFVYDPTGHLSIHIMRNPPAPPLASGEWKRATEAEKTNAYDGYVGYFGTYRVDREKHVLHHIVEGALNPMYTSTVQERPYRLSGDVLIIELDDAKDGTHYYRELRRVR